MGTKNSRTIRIYTIIFCLLAFLLVPSGIRPASAIYTVIVAVDTNIDSPINSGCSEIDDDDDCSLRGAINIANADLSGAIYHIDIPDGIYLLDYNSGNPGEDANASGDLDILNPTVELHGESMLFTRIDGNLTDRVIDYLDEYGSLTLTALTIRNGSLAAGEGGGAGIHLNESSTLHTNFVRIHANHASGPNDDLNNGGGIRSPGGATLDLLHTAIFDNSACNGGGIWTLNTTLTLDHSEITDNTADCDGGLGGGLSLFGTGTHTILDSTIDGNDAYRGAGLFGGYLTIIDSTFKDNIAGSSGGGLDLFEAVSLNDVTLWNNSAGSKGGGLTVEGAVDLYNVTFAGNDAPSGGGVYVSTGEDNSVSMDHVSFAANTSNDSGSAIYAATDSVVDVSNSILASPEAPYTCFIHATADWTSFGFNISNDGSCLLSSTGDWSNTNPLLGTLGDFGGATMTLPLLTGSPAINLGDPDDPTDRLDQRGVPIVGGRSDIGAFEYYPPVLWLPLTIK